MRPQMQSVSPWATAGRDEPRDGSPSRAASTPWTARTGNESPSDAPGRPEDRQSSPSMRKPPTLAAGQAADAPEAEGSPPLVAPGATLIADRASTPTPSASCSPNGSPDDRGGGVGDGHGAGRRGERNPGPSASAAQSGKTVQSGAPAAPRPPIRIRRGQTELGEKRRPTALREASRRGPCPRRRPDPSGETGSARAPRIPRGRAVRPLPGRRAA